MATYERLDYGSTDGSQWGGASTDLIGFFGTTPVSQYASDGYSASTYVVTTGGITAFAFSSLDGATKAVGTLSSIRAAMLYYGLMP